MTAKLTDVKVQRSAFDYTVIQYIVSIDGRGIFSAMSRQEADDFIERVNNYPKLWEEAQEARWQIERLKEQVRKLRRTQKKKGGKK